MYFFAVFNYFKNSDLINYVPRIWELIYGIPTSLFKVEVLNTYVYLGSGSYMYTIILLLIVIYFFFFLNSGFKFHV